MLRRDFLKMAGLVMAAPNLAYSEEKSDKSVIFVWLGGGISHIETFNPVPEAPVEIRSIRGAIKTKTTELMIGGDFPELAKISNKFNIIRSLNHKVGDHSAATGWVLTGEFQVPNAGQSHPCFGSVISHQIGPNSVNGTPNFVKVSPIEYDKASFLGARHNGYDANDDGVTNLFARVPEKRFDKRIEIMREIDKHGGKKDYLSQSWNELKGQAVQIIKGDAAKAFDFKYETEQNKLKYNIEKDRFGRDVLLAKRLIAAKSRFIHISFNGWDNHTDLDESFKVKGPILDKYLALLINDLYEEGLNKDVMVVVCSEFGRTYKRNVNQSRDHWNQNNTLLIAGGDFQQGRVIGKTDQNASTVTDKPFLPCDVIRTMFDHFNLDKNLIIVDNQARPRHMIAEDAKNILI